MKKLLTTIAIVVGIGLLSGYSKNVLLEMVTNNGCPSCPPADAEFDTIAARYDTIGVFGIKYHAWWPNSSDPFYVYNPTESAARINYYRVNYTPHLNVNGSIDGGWQYSSWENLTLSQLGTSTPINLSLNINYDDQSRTGIMITTISADAPVNYSSLKLRYAITESNIRHTSPNGELIHNHVFRDMLPNVGGKPITISSGQTIIDTQEFTTDTLWVLPNCEFIVFLQDDNTKEVLQVTGTHISINHPSIHVENVRVDDSGGNNNGRAEPGETVNIIITLQNQRYYQDAHGVIATLRTRDTSVTITDSVSNYGDLPAGSSRQNNTDPFVIQVHTNANVHMADFTVHVAAGSYEADLPFRIEIGFPQLLVVDDDGGNHYENFLYPYLDSIVTLYDTWDVNSNGEISESILANYRYVLWFTGDNFLSDGSISALSNYLNRGGRLFITGQNIAENLSGNPFLSTYLHATFLSSNFQGLFINGISGDPIGDGLHLVASGPGSAMNQTSKDVIQPTGGASKVLIYGTYSDSSAGVRYSGNYKVVFFSFGIEGLGELPPTYQGKVTVLRRVLSWLGMDVSISEQNHITIVPIRAYPNPSNGKINFVLPNGVHNGTIKIFDISGKLVTTLDITRTHVWNGKDRSGLPLPPGVYFYSFNGRIRGRLVKIK